MPIVSVDSVDNNLFARFYSFLFFLGDQQSLLQTDPDKKKVIGELVDKFKGEDADPWTKEQPGSCRANPEARTQ